MKFSVKGQEKVTFQCRWLLNRGDDMGRFDCNWSMAKLSPCTSEIEVYCNNFSQNYIFLHIICDDLNHTVNLKRFRHAYILKKKDLSN
jgi:hypothetical protein